MIRPKSLLLSAVFLATAMGPALAEPTVVASIKPVHSLVAGVMEGVGTPSLLVEGAGSPHAYALKPSQAKRLEESDVVFWIGHELEAFLEGPIETIARDAVSVELIDARGLTRLAFREGGAFEAHGHDDHDDHHDHGDHDDHAHESKGGHEHDHDHDHAHDHDRDHDHDHDHAHDHGHDEAAEAEHHDHDHHHEHGAFDAHVWLDPQNAKALVREIAATLVGADPANAGTYEANAATLVAKLDALTADVAAMVEPVRDRHFIVFHDAYQYFEARFGVTAVGSVTVSPEVMPGAERIGEIRAKVKDLDVACVFAEPQFEPKLVSVVTEGTPAKTGVLDPLGAALDDGPDLYFTLIRNMAASVRSCLSAAS